MKLIFICLCTTLVSSIDLSREHKTYNGYTLLELMPRDNEQLDIVHDLSQDYEIDFWSEWTKPNLPVRCMVPPDMLSGTIEYIEEYKIPYTVLNHDIGVQVAEELQQLRTRVANNMVFDINNFNTYEDIMTELDAMTTRCPGGLTCTVETLGFTYENREIKVLRISAGAAISGFWMDSAIHAREWLAPATVLRIMDLFTRNYSIDPDVTNLIDSFDWHFVPIMNPDGYEFSWTDERYWRKSRNINANSTCMGTDLNRNYDSHWSSDGTSNDTCSDVYHGSGPGSEPETQVIQNELVRLGPSLAGVVSVHTAAQMWLHPWGYTELGGGGPCVRAPDHDEMYRVASAAADATEDTFGTVWARGTICETIYPASGTTCDFGKEGAGVTYSFTPELRGPDFVTPPSEIEPSFQEFYNGVKAMVAAIKMA